MPWYLDAVKRMGRKKWFASVGKHVAPHVDRAVIRLSGGRLRTSDRSALPTLLLTHTGRTSGKERRTPLLFLRDGDRLVVAGSNWGQADDPQWARNLIANPQASVQVGRNRWEVTARVAEGEERARLWDRLRELWPAYDNYAERSGRNIKVFVLEPRGGARPSPEGGDEGTTAPPG